MQYAVGYEQINLDKDLAVKSLRKTIQNTLQPRNIYVRLFFIDRTAEKFDITRGFDMKRFAFWFICALFSGCLTISCMSHTTPGEVMDGYHSQLNKGAVGMALSYVANDATFEINADPIAGGNGRYYGREEVRLWLNMIAENYGVAEVFGMDLTDGMLTCLLRYEDSSLDGWGLHEIELIEEAVIEDGFIQNYVLTIRPVTHERLDNFSALIYLDPTRVDPADLKFYMPDFFLH